MSTMEAWFTQRVMVYRRASTTEWVASGFETVGPVTGFVQPGSGGMATTSGAVMPNAAYTLFCPDNSNIILGDRIVDNKGRTYITIDTQIGGVAGIGDHMEVTMELQDA